MGGKLNILILNFIMKNTIITLFATSTFIFAQKNQAPANSISKIDSDYGIKENVFRNALKYGDLIVAKSALYEMIVLKPAEKSLKDTLALIYINLGQAQQAILLTRAILEENPNNLSMLEVKAVALQSLGITKDALLDFENLYAKQKNVYHLYQIANLQYELKRIAECNSSVDQILSVSEVDKKEIPIEFGTSKGEQQKVSLKAAALNIKGMLALDLNELNLAKACFDEALKISPNFVLAKNNLLYIQNKSQPISKTTKPQN